ncbi:MAG: GNAT family N-acetyltransferase [Lentisphaeria bacterium]|nr:GNAT family N-acetyltransferase [Lentisphaeria bacterium]
MELIRLEDESNEIFRIICDWNYNWWGISGGKSKEEVDDFMRHSLCVGRRMPQTFVALENGAPVGMYQIAVFDDLEVRPNIYPWLINVYVDEAQRGRGVCRFLMGTVPEMARRIGLPELFLYTKHVGLYEKFGWICLEHVDTFKNEPRVQGIYKLEIAARQQS